VNPPALTLRAARESDASALCSVHARAIRGSAATHYGKDVLDAWAGRTRPDGYALAIRTHPVIVAEVPVASGSRIVGFAQLQPDEGVVEAVYVDPDFARQGIGRTLFLELERLARTLGLPGLTVEASLNSAPFYAAMGCARRATDRHELAPGVHFECVVMDKRLAATAGAAA
jgi:GNAT superfamily N-acetyltransferase